MKASFVISSPDVASCPRSRLAELDYLLNNDLADVDVAKQGKTTVSLDELANPFSGNICRHIKKEERQATNASSSFLEACSDFVKEKISHEQLINCRN